jgi:hypothetical protein
MIEVTGSGPPAMKTTTLVDGPDFVVVGASYGGFLGRFRRIIFCDV